MSPLHNKQKLKKKEIEVPESIAAYKKNPRPDLLTKALDDHEALITSAVRSFSGGYTSPVIKAKARILAAEAIKTYDPALGAIFKTHLYTRLMPLRRLAPKVTEPISIPEQMTKDMKKLKEAETYLSDMLGYEPTDADIADFTGISLKRLGKVRKANKPVAEGSFIGNKEDEAFSVHSPPVQGKTREETMLDYLYYDLSDLDKKIFEYRVGYNGRDKLANIDIAKLLKRDPKWVSQRASIIQEKINNVLGRAV